MKKIFMILSVVFALVYINVKATVLDETEYIALGIRRSYIVGDYIFDLSKHNPTLRDLLLAAQTEDKGETYIIEIKNYPNIDGEDEITYTELLTNTKYTSMPNIDVKYVYESSIGIENEIYRVLYADITGITLDRETAEINYGDTLNLNVTVTPSNANVNDISWSSSNTNVAIVENGIVTGVGGGTTTITASFGDITASCEITVNEILVESITMEESITLIAGEPYTLTPTFLPTDASNKTLTWKSSNSKIATVDSEGAITGVKAGTVTITATSANGKKAECEVKVISITKLSETTTVTIDNTKQLSATVAGLIDNTVTWTSSDEDIVTVDQTGLITGISEGTATVYATGGQGLMTSTEVTVSYGSVSSVNIKVGTNPITFLPLKIGSSYQLEHSITATATDKSVTWSSGNTKILTVDENGLIHALKAGTCKITLYANDGDTTMTEIKKNSYDSITVAVISDLVEETGISLDKTSITIAPRKIEQLNLTFSPSNTTDKNVSWTSSNTKVATVDQYGMVTAGDDAGTTIITATSRNGKIATCEVIVKKIGIEEINLDIPSNQLAVDDNTLMVTASVSPSTAYNNKTVKWTNSNPEVLEIKNVTAKSGTWTLERNSKMVKVIPKGNVGDKATITATIGDITKSVEITLVASTVPISSDGTINNDYFGIKMGTLSNITKEEAKNNSVRLTRAVDYAIAKNLNENTNITPVVTNYKTCSFDDSLNLRGISYGFTMPTEKQVSIKLTKGTYMVYPIEHEIASRDYTQQHQPYGILIRKGNLDFNLNESTIGVYTNGHQRSAAIYVGTAENVTVRNGKIIGDRDTHTCGDGTLFATKKSCPKDSLSTHESNHGIQIVNAQNVLIQDVEISKFWGDGILIFAGTAKAATAEAMFFNHNIKIDNTKIYDIRRDCVTANDGNGIYITNNTFVGGWYGVKNEPVDDQYARVRKDYNQCLIDGYPVSNLIVYNNVMYGFSNGTVNVARTKNVLVEQNKIARRIPSASSHYRDDSGFFRITDSKNNITVKNNTVVSDLDYDSSISVPKPSETNIYAVHENVNKLSIRADNVNSPPMVRIYEKDSVWKNCSFTDSNNLCDFTPEEDVWAEPIMTNPDFTQKEYDSALKSLLEGKGTGKRSQGTWFFIDKRTNSYLKNAKVVYNINTKAFDIYDGVTAPLEQEDTNNIPTYYFDNNGRCYSGCENATNVRIYYYSFSSTFKDIYVMNNTIAPYYEPEPREGYVFKGWSKSSYQNDINNPVLYDFNNYDESRLTGETKLYAVWDIAK